MKSTIGQTASVHQLHPSSSSEDELSAIRQALLGPSLEHQRALETQIAVLNEQLEALRVSAADCSQILPSSIRKLHASNQTLTEELEPEISAVVDRCFKEQPEKMAEALYPVLGPAVRKLIANLFSPGEQDSAKPYEVEQVFLIHRETSLVLRHAILHDGEQRDPDLVSGMLNAIRAFVQDAFELSEFDGMNSIELGDLRLWVEWGPKAILAVVVRGFPDQSVKDQYAETLRQVHLQYAAELSDFSGDAKAFDNLELADVWQQSNTATNKANSAKPLLTVSKVLCIGALLMFAGESYFSHHRFWSSAITQLESAPGVVLLSAETDYFSKPQLQILRDPRAASEQSLLDRANIVSEKVLIKWYLYQSQDPRLGKVKSDTGSLLMQSASQPARNPHIGLGERTGDAL